MNYDYADRVIKYLNKRLVEMFSPLKSILAVDELNVMKRVTTVYNDAYVLAKKMFRRLANHYYADESHKAYANWLDEQWIEDILTAYDPVSKYVFDHEIDRKRARLFEALIASTDRAKEVDTALRLLSFQIRTYVIEIADAAQKQALEDAKVTKVKWRAENDSKTCSVCYKRDNKVYLLSAVPPKPHPNCRCWLERVKS